MKRTVKIALIALIAVIIISAIIFLIWALMAKPEIIFKPASEPAVEEAGGLPATGTGTGGAVIEIEPETPAIVGSSSAEIEKQKVINLSKLFAERFGSFSNQSDYQNLKDVMPLMTASLRNWAENYIAGNPQPSDAPYYGVSSKAVSSNIKDIDIEAGRAELDIETQRYETRAGEEPRAYYQTLNLMLIKSGNDWLIDNAKWR